MSLLDTKRPPLWRSALTNYGAFAVNMIVGVAITPYVITGLGDTTYGLWSVIGSITAYLTLIDLGLSATVGRYVALYAGARDARAIAATVSAGALIFTGIAVVLFVSSWGLIAPVASFFNVPKVHLPALHMALPLVTLSMGVGLLSNVFAGTLGALEHFAHLNAVVVVSRGVRGAAMIAAVYGGYGLVGVALADLVGSCLLAIGNYVALKRLHPDLHLGLAVLDHRITREIFSFGCGVSVVSIGHMMTTRIAPIVIGRMLSLEAVTTFSIASLAGGYMISLMTAGFSVFRARFAFFTGAERSTEMIAVFLRSVSFSGTLAFGGGAVAVVAFPAFVSAWMGPGHAAAVPVFWIMAAGYVSVLSVICSHQVLEAQGRIRAYGTLLMVEVGVNALLSVLLVEPFGLLGAVLGMSLPMIFLRVLAGSWYTARVLEIPVMQVWMRLLPTALAAAAAVVAGLILFDPEHAGTWTDFAASAGFTSVTFAVLMLAACWLCRITGCRVAVLQDLFEFATAVFARLRVQLTG